MRGSWRSGVQCWGVCDRGWHSQGTGPGDHPDPRMLPHADQALVDEAKICYYLLSDTHPVGRFKARVFRSLCSTMGRLGRFKGLR